MRRSSDSLLEWVASEDPSMIKAFAPLALLSSLLSFHVSHAMADTVPRNVVTELAPSGKLRGVSSELARELAKRLAVPIEFVTFDAAGKVFDALQKGAWDIAFLAIDPVRAAGIDFTAPYVVIEGAYIVPADSPLKTVEEVDREGVRVAVARASAYDLFLTRALKHAKLVREPSGPEALALFRKERLEAAAGVKQPIVAFAKEYSDTRVIPGRFMVIEQAMGTPKGRDAGLRYLRAFIEEMKASGFVAKALSASGQADAAVAPPSPVR